MGTTADKLNRVLATKNALKAALIEKGQDPGDVFSQYPEKIRAIQTDSIKLSSIEITKQPNKVAYTAFESFNPDEMGVEANYSNGAHKALMPKGYTMPEGYTQVEYIESTGTQYIDSGWFPSGISYDIECGFEITGDAADQTIFGYLNKLTVNAMVGVNTFQIGMSGPWTNAKSSLCAKNIFLDIMLSSVYGHQKAIINGETIYEDSVTELMILTNIGLFAWNNGGGTYLYPASGKMYHFRARENGILVRDFIPCINQNGEAGLFDLVNSQFYANAGSGAFVTGPELSSDGYEVTDGNRLTADQNHVTISYAEYGVTKTVSQEVSVQTIAANVPSVNESFTYTGSVLTPTWSNYDSSIMSISGNTSGTGAGTYTATFGLKDKVNYRWSDGSTSDKSVNWTIGKASVAIPTANSTSFTYNGSAVTLSLSNYDSALVSASGTSATTAGNYTATFALKDSNNYQWSDGTTANKTIAWVINKVSVEIPIADITTFSYTGSVITPTWSNYNSALMSIGGTTSAIESGSYVTTFALKDKINYVWSDGSTEDKATTWKIEMPTVALTLVNTQRLIPGPTFCSVKAIVNEQEFASATSLDTAVIFVPIGTVVRCEISNASNAVNVYVNGENVSSATGSLVYEYTVTTEAVIKLQANSTYSGTITIFDEIGGYFNIDDVEYKIIDEMTWAEWVKSGVNTTDMTYNTFGIKNADGSLALLSDIIVNGASYTRCTDMAKVTITGTGEGQFATSMLTGASVGILGVSRTTATELSVPTGTVLKCYASRAYNQGSMSDIGGTITINGETVVTGGGSYDYTLTGDIEAKLSFSIAMYYGSPSAAGTVTITEQ